MTNTTAGYIFQLLGIIAGIWLFWVLHSEKQVAQWPKTIGDVLESEITQDTDANEEPSIRYRYSVAAQSYICNCIHLQGVIASSGGYARELVTKHPAGSRVQIYYDPSNPARAALYPTIPSWIKMMLLAGALAFIFFGELFKRM